MRVIRASGSALRARALPTVRPRHAPAAGLVRAAAASPAGVSEGASEQQIFQLIADKEAQLADMFERRPLPKASEVAALRTEITQLKASLPPSAVAPPVVQRRAPKPQDAELAARVMAELEAALSNHALGNAEDQEIARLEATNTVLRADAHALLQHQSLLENMVREARAAAAVLEQTQGILGRMKAKLGADGVASE